MSYNNQDLAIIWDRYIGLNIFEAPCLVCQRNHINHHNLCIIPVFKNCLVTPESVRPVCESCHHNFLNDPNTTLYQYMQSAYLELPSNFFKKHESHDMEIEYPFCCYHCRYSGIFQQPRLRCPSCFTPVVL